jgi:hypothetical protein
MVMGETFRQVLLWLVTGGGIGSAISWITSRKKRRAAEAKAVHDIYKSMYEDVKHTLMELTNENDKLRKMVAKLDRTIQKAVTCRYWGDCPIRDSGLPDNKAVLRMGKRHGAAGQPPIRTPPDSHPSHPDGDGEAGDTGEGTADTGEPTSDGLPAG